MARISRKKQKKRKEKTVDPDTAEETAKRIVATEAKRQEVIQVVKRSLERRRMEKLERQKGKLKKEESARQKTVGDAKKSQPEMIHQIREDLSGIVETGIKCVYTSAIVPKQIKFDGRNTLTIKGVKYKIKNNLHIVGWGKEAVTMSSAIERIVGKQLKKGLIVAPFKTVSTMWSFPKMFPRLDSRISYVEAGADGLPDKTSVEATRKILAYCKKLKKRDLLIVILSKGVDNFLCCPRDCITLEDKKRILDRLEATKATVDEINVVRNKLSAIRGGDLARMAYPARIIILITSGVSAEPLGSLAGGPCAFESKDLRAQSILIKYRIAERMPQSVRELVEEINPWTAADNQLDEKNNYKFVQQYVIACNVDAIECMSVAALRLGLVPLKLNSDCSGKVEDFAREYAKLASLMVLAIEGKLNKLEMYEMMKESPICPLTEKRVQEIFPSKDKWGLGLCLLLGGRPTVNLCSSPGTGGPNQELALYFSLYWYMRTEQYPILKGYTVWFLGGSSYGRDGNSGAAGAFGYKNLTTNVYPEHEKAKDRYKSARLKWWKLTEDGQSEAEILAAYTEMKDSEAIKEKYEAILPERVLQEHNTTWMFLNVNDGNDLLKLRGGNDYMYTHVGDLHVIRIVRFECNCDGTCRGNQERTCADRECSVNQNLSVQVGPKSQYCCRTGTPKMH